MTQPAFTPSIFDVSTYFRKVVTNGKSYSICKVESGVGKAVLNGVSQDISDGFAIVVPTGTLHNIINTSADKPMKLYTLYSPPNHKDGTIHKTKEEAEANEEHFNGKTTE